MDPMDPVFLQIILIYVSSTGAFVCRGGVEIAKFTIFRDKSRNRRFSAKNRDIDNFPRQIAI